MKKKYKNISIFLILLINILFISLFGGCDYFKLMSRKEWEEKYGIQSTSFLYAYDGSNTIKVYKINYNNNGNIEEISGSPFTIGNGNINSNSMSIDPSGNFMYISTTSPNKKIYGFYINTKGEFSHLQDSPVDVSNLSSPDNLNISPDSNYLFLSDKISGFNETVSIFKIDEASGKLGKISDSDLGNMNTSLATRLDRTGKYLYFNYTFGTSNYISTYKVNNNGSLTYTSNSNIGFTSSENMETDNSGRSLYFVGYASANINLYRNDNGSLSSITSYSLGGNCMGNKIKIAPDSTYLAASARDSDNVLLYKIDQNTGLLYNNYVLSCSNTPVELTFDPTAKYVYVVADNGAGGNIIRILKINDNGTLSEINGSPYSYSGNKIRFLQSIKK